MATKDKINQQVAKISAFATAATDSKGNVQKLTAEQLGSAMPARKIKVAEKPKDDPKPKKEVSK